MSSLKAISGVGIWLIITLIITLATGIMLHLKSHGTVVEPRHAIKAIHAVAGIAMAALAWVHGRQFWRPFAGALKRRAPMSIVTALLAVLLTATVATVLVKMLSPVKIHGLGLWHYALGILMTVTAIIHLLRGLPMLRKMLYARRKSHA